MFSLDILFAYVAAGILAYVTLIWVFSLIKHDAGIVDIFWGLGFVGIASGVYWFESVNIPRQLVVLGLVWLWGLRLALHIMVRNWGKPEDWRYAKWRLENGTKWWWYSYFKVFLLQGGFMALIALPLVMVQFSPIPDDWTDWDTAGLVLWGLGFFFEAVGDWQLLRFKRNDPHPNDVMNTGLWRYTRHPNYFGEAVLWWGFGCFAVAAGAWWTLMSPLVLTGLLLKVSGVAMLETGLKARRPAYAEYMAQTSAFFPWFSKNKS